MLASTGGGLLHSRSQCICSGGFGTTSSWRARSVLQLGRRPALACAAQPYLLYRQLQWPVAAAAGGAAAAGRGGTVLGGSGAGGPTSPIAAAVQQRWQRQRAQAQQQQGVCDEGGSRAEVKFKYVYKGSVAPRTIKLFLGTYDNPADAARVADAACVGLGKAPANFLDHDYISHPLTLRLQEEKQRGASCEELQTVVRDVLRLKANDKQNTYSTEFTGVEKQRSYKNYYPQIGIQHFFYRSGTYPTAEAAAYVYDRVVVRLWGTKAQLNFPLVQQGKQPPPCELHPDLEAVLRNLRLQGEQLLQEVRAARAIFKSGTTSEYTGVNWFKRDELWEAKITVQRKSIFLGRFPPPLEQEAARMRDRAALYRRHLGLVTHGGHLDALNSPKEDYEGDALLLGAVTDGISMAEFAKRCQEAAMALREGGVVACEEYVDGRAA